MYTADQECYVISTVFKILKSFVHKKIRQKGGAQTLRRLAYYVKRHFTECEKPMISLLNL